MSQSAGKTDPRRTGERRFSEVAAKTMSAQFQAEKLQTGAMISTLGLGSSGGCSHYFDLTLLLRNLNRPASFRRSRNKSTEPLLLRRSLIHS
jgi:hypothetical protein